MYSRLGSNSWFVIHKIWTNMAAANKLSNTLRQKCIETNKIFFSMNIRKKEREKTILECSLSDTIMGRLLISARFKKKMNNTFCDYFKSCMLNFGYILNMSIFNKWFTFLSPIRLSKKTFQSKGVVTMGLFWLFQT